MADNNLKLKGYMQMNINLGEIREFTETDRKNLNANTAARHTHDNKNALDKIKGIDNAPTKDSENVLTSGSVYDALTGKVNSKYLGGVDFNQIFEPGIYTVNIKECTHAPELPSTGLYSEAWFITPLPHYDGEYDCTNQLLIVSGYNDSGEYFRQYIRYIGRPKTGKIEVGDWVKISDNQESSGGNNVNIDLSDYYTKEEITTKLEDEYVTKTELLSLEEDVIKNAENLSQKASMSEVEAYIEETILGGAW